MKIPCNKIVPILSNNTFKFYITTDKTKMIGNLKNAELYCLKTGKVQKFDLTKLFVCKCDITSANFGDLGLIEKFTITIDEKIYTCDVVYDKKMPNIKMVSRKNLLNIQKQAIENLKVKKEKTDNIFAK